MTSQSTHSAYRDRKKLPAVIYAACFSETIGRCRLPSWKSTWNANRSPGCPATIVRGLAHGDIAIMDATMGMDAFKGFVYPFDPPCP